MKLGIIGLNEGNGHPYSYSAIFNGYNPKALNELCPFPLIKDYLPRDHQNKNSISGAKVTHIWTQQKEVSEKVAQVSLIPDIVDDYQDLISLVDGVILARDDIENHFSMAEPFLKKGIPIFIDKQVVHTEQELQQLQLLTKNQDYPLMACSALRYNPHLRQLMSENKIPAQPVSIQGISRVNWLRYAHHLFEGIAMLYGTDISYVQYLGFDERHELFLIKYKDALSVTLEFHLDVKLPIRFNIHSQDGEHREIQFNDFFHSFKAMLMDFVKVVELRRPVIPLQEIFDIAKVVLAGEKSKNLNGLRIDPKTLREQHAQ